MANDAKYKINMAKRSGNQGKSDFIKATGKYAMKFLFLNTDDEVLYKYKKKLKKQI